MPELPEIRHMAGQMNSALPGRIIQDFTCAQDKCLNMPAEAFRAAVAGRTVVRVSSRGKWIFIALDDGGRIALSLGMGGNAVLHAAGEPPREGARIGLVFADSGHLSIGFWWFGYFHHIAPGAPHAMTDALGPEPLDDSFTPERLLGLLRTRAAVKTVLLDQRRIAGIGNFYIHDMLWRAQINPLTPACELTAADAARLHGAMREYLSEALALGGASYERDLYDAPGGYGRPRVGYRQGEPCDRCGAPIEKVKTGGTHSFVCPACQPRMTRSAGK
ncbi:MAG: Fpg/Nei family DNA glycosylase [Christensenellales bacterium]